MALKLNLKAATKAVKTTAAITSNAASKAATKFRNLALQKDDIESSLKIAREELAVHVNPVRDAQLKSGNADTNIKIPTDDGNRVMVVFQERFSLLDSSNIDPLKESFGKSYPLFVEEESSFSFKKGTTLESLEKALGKKPFQALMASIEITEGVKPRKGSFESVAKLYVAGETEMAEDLLTFIDATVSSPQFRAK